MYAVVIRVCKVVKMLVVHCLFVRIPIIFYGLNQNQKFLWSMIVFIYDTPFHYYCFICVNVGINYYFLYTFHLLRP